MSNFYYGAPHHPSHLNTHSHNHHGGRSRRAPRISAAHNAHNKFRPTRSPKEVVESAHIVAFRRDFESARSFDIEDDEMFCPFHLLTEDDLQSIHSSGSDRSSLTSGSPESSPQQHQIQPTPSFVFSSSSSSASSYSGYQHNAHTKIHQPLAQRTRNAIPIVDPTTRAVASPASPPPSVSPAQMQQYGMNGRW